ncbi:MAG: MaoC/PaaZ C-terminal domain-containing protein, partial [Alphaproteobacteria bacterium]
HIDAVAAAAGPTGGLCANWLQVLSTCFRLFIEAGGFADTGEASPGLESARSVAPVRPGDTVRATIEVVAKRPLRSRPQSGLMINEFKMFNQRDEIVVIMRLKSFMRRDPDRVAAEMEKVTS